MRCLSLAVVLLLLLAPAATVAAEAGKNCTPAGVKKGYPPKYPAELVATKAKGETVVRLLVGVDGRVLKTMLETSSGHDRLDEVALAAVKDWEFEPQRCDGKAEQSWALIPLRFDGSQKLDPPPIAEDDRPLGFADVDAGVAYLAHLSDIQHRAIGPQATLYMSTKERAIWTLVSSTPPTRHRAITRWRVDTRTTPPRQVYRFLCEGPADWCAERLEQEKQARRDRPMPTPPPA